MSLSAIIPSPIPFLSGRSRKMPCPEWRGFVEMYAQAARSLSEAINALPLAPGAEFNRAWERAERARKIFDEARTALLRHEHGHDCASQRPSAV